MSRAIPSSECVSIGGSLQKYYYQATYEQEELKVYCSGGMHNLVDVLHILQEQQIAIGRVYTTLPTLNDVFLEITGKALRDQEG